MFATKLGNNIMEAQHFLDAGETVGIPTETVYGLAANAFNTDAVLKIFQIKQRPTFNPLIVHTYSIAAINNFVTEINDTAMQLMQAFMPGPISFLLPRNTTIIPDIVCSGLSQVAVRIPNNKLTLNLLQQLQYPLCAPSANKFGYVSPTTAKHVLQGLQGEIPFILDDGPCSVGIESTIVECTSTHIIMHRQGGITEQQIAAISSLPIIKPIKGKLPATSGQLKSHYATNTPLYLDNIASNLLKFADKNVAVISLQKIYNNNTYPLSTTGNLLEAAKNLFAILRALDGVYDIIIAEKMPNTGLGIAINDRLFRAQQNMK